MKRTNRQELKGTRTLSAMKLDRTTILLKTKPRWNKRMRELLDDWGMDDVESWASKALPPRLAMVLCDNCKSGDYLIELDHGTLTMMGFKVKRQRDEIFKALDQLQDDINEGRYSKVTARAVVDSLASGLLHRSQSLSAELPPIVEELPSEPEPQQQKTVGMGLTPGAKQGKRMTLSRRELAATRVQAVDDLMRPQSARKPRRRKSPQKRKKRSVTKKMATFGLKKEQIEEIHELFHTTFGTREKESLTQEDLYQAFERLGQARSMEEISIMMMEWDANGDGVIDFNEFLMMIKKQDLIEIHD